MNEKSPIGSRLRAERERLGLGQLDLSVAGGVNRNTQGAYEKGERSPDAAYLAAAARLGVDVLYVVTGVRTQAAGLSPVQSRLLDYFSAADDDAQRAALLVLEALARLEPVNRQPQPLAPSPQQRNLEGHPDIDQAIAALASAESVGDIARGASAFIQALQLERYTIIAFRGHEVTLLIHNAPPAIELPMLEEHDPVVARARMSRIPVVWQSGSGGDWRERFGDSGYRCGAAGAALDGSGAGCVLMVSSSDEKLPEAHLPTLLGCTLMAAVTVNDPLRKLAAATDAAKPFTQNQERRLG